MSAKPRAVATAQLSPGEFLERAAELRHIATGAQRDLEHLLRFRGWARRDGKRTSPARFAKLFPDGLRFRLPAAQALQLEESYCTAVARFET